MSELEPVDTRRCQGRKPGREVFSNGTKGPWTLMRCDQSPLFVATQINPGPDGLRGSQSCCHECLDRLHREHPGFASQVTLKEWIEKNRDERSDERKSLIDKFLKR